jgi:putative peptidoglycan lipid II flippase
LLPFSFVYMVQRAFFALEDTQTPFWFTVAQISLHISGSITLGVVLPAENLVVGLAALTSATLLVQAVLAGWLLTKRIGAWARFDLAKSMLKYAIAAGLTLLFGLSILRLVGGADANSYALSGILPAVTIMGVVGGAMLVCYLVALKLLRVHELDAVLQGVKGIFRK